LANSDSYRQTRTAIKLQKLFSRFKSPENILQARHIELQTHEIDKTIIEGIQTTKENAIQCDLAWLEHENHHSLTIQDPA
jgi:predicted Rossmann fold nucleotide-binding protein DprA/Smf involved in DNA uptake